jgi:hypothetical protein
VKNRMMLFVAPVTFPKFVFVGRDGEQDNRITPRAKKCPKCDAIMSPKFHCCLFCGYKGESPVMI